MLVPGRYAKREVSSGFMPAIDVYAYRAPSADAGVRRGAGGAEDARRAAGETGERAPTDPGADTSGGGGGGRCGPLT